MIAGMVNRYLEIVLPFSIQDSGNHFHAMEAILDTGFTGALTLPTAVIAQLGLPWHSRNRATLANGKLEEFDLHLATIDWNGSHCKILVQAIDFVPLLGLALMIDHELTVRFQIGGAVRVDSIT